MNTKLIKLVAWSNGYKVKGVLFVRVFSAASIAIANQKV